MNCLNSCVAPLINTTAPAGVTSSCNLSCTTSRLTCKQRCWGAVAQFGPGDEQRKRLAVRPDDEW